MLSFLKMHGLGNDFVVFDRRGVMFELTVPQLCKLADRRFGVGCDQIVFLDKPEIAEADGFMRIRNADGTVAETCGNAARCIGHLLMMETGKDNVVIQTVVGLLRCRREQGSRDVIVDMGPPRLVWDQIPLAQDVDTLHVPLSVGGYSDPVAVSMGNPHIVFFVDDVASVPLAEVGPQIETHAMFPRKINVEFAQRLGPNHVRMRVWERGAGITSACGTGACATLVAAVRRGLVAPGEACKITLDGGELVISWQGGDASVMMAGSATTVFSGAWIDV